MSRARPSQTTWKGLGAILFLLGLGQYLCAQTNTNSFPAFTLEKARDYLQALSQTVQVQAGTNVETLYIQASLQSRLGRKDEAERLARAALQSDPNRADIYSFLVNLFIRQDRSEEATETLRKALQIDPNLNAGYRRLGMLLDRLGDHSGAREAFTKAINQSTNDATARLLLGRLLLDQGQPKEAIAHLQQACQLDPESANNYYVLFQAQSKAGDQEAASRSLQTFRALQKKERNAMATEDDSYDNEADMRTLTAGFHSQMAHLLMRQGQEALAESHLRQATQIAPQEPKAYELLSDFLLRKGRLSEAKALCEHLVRLQPKQVTYGVNYGTVLLQLQDYSAAAAELKRVLEIEPKQTAALHNLARLYLNTRHELPEALALCERLVNLAPNAVNYDLLAWACYANGQTNKALTASAQAIEKDPGNLTFREHHRRLQQAATLPR